jgi:hypothetical protein
MKEITIQDQGKRFQRLCFFKGKKFILIRVQKGPKITIQDFLSFLVNL